MQTDRRDLSRRASSTVEAECLTQWGNLSSNRLRCCSRWKNTSRVCQVPQLARVTPWGRFRSCRIFPPRGIRSRSSRGAARISLICVVARIDMPTEVPQDTTIAATEWPCHGIEA